MRIREILQVRRVGGCFDLYGYKIRSVRKASDGYAVLVVFEVSEVDKDFLVALGPHVYSWFPVADDLAAIEAALDFSDRLTADWLRNGRGWNSGPRPFRW
jgi:hypothetical protein